NEEIDWNFIDFGLDLEPTIRLIESSNPIGILSYLDEECIMPGGTDRSFLEKIEKISGVNGVNFKDNFRIKHYAGEVEYSVDNWLMKNRDVESLNLIEHISSSTTKSNNSFNMNSNTINSINSINDMNSSVTRRNRRSRVTFRDADAASFIQQNKVTNNESYCSITKEILSFSRSNGKSGIFKTVAQQHRESLNFLMETLKGTEPHFVRCILPNLEKEPGKFCKALVLDQLRCNGVLEGIRISRLGYPNRMLFSEFVCRYKILLADMHLNNIDINNDNSVNNGVNNSFNNDSINKNNDNSCDNVDIMYESPECLNKMVKELKINNYKIGKTMIFFRQGVLADLEDRRENAMAKICGAIQNIVRMQMEVKRREDQDIKMKGLLQLQRNSADIVKMLRWKWWRLIMRIKPLLNDDGNSKRRIAIEELEGKIENYKEEIKNTKELLNSKNKELSSAFIEVEEKKREVKMKSAEIENKEELLNVLREEKASLVLSRKENIHMIKELENKIEVLNDTLNQLKDDYNKLESEMKIKENLIESLNSKIVQKDSEIQNKIKEIEMIAHEDLKNVLQEKEDEIKRLKNAIDEINKSLNNREKQNARLNSTLELCNKEIQEQNTAIENMRNEILEMTSREKKHISHIEGYKIMNSKLKEENDDVELEINKLRDENENHLMRAEHGEKEKMKMQKEIEFYRGRVENLEGGFKEIQKMHDERKVVEEFYVCRECRQYKGLSINNSDNANNTIDIDINNSDINNDVNIDNANNTIDINNSNLIKNENNYFCNDKKCLCYNPHFKLIKNYNERIEREKAFNKNLMDENDNLRKENEEMSKASLRNFIEVENKHGGEMNILNNRIRKLEQENNQLKKELSGSETSEELSCEKINYERINRLYERERSLKNKLELQLIGMEGENTRLAGEIELLRENSSSVNNSMLNDKIEHARLELENIRRHLNTTVHSLQDGFLKLNTDREAYYCALVDEFNKVYDALITENTNYKMKEGLFEEMKNKSALLAEQIKMLSSENERLGVEHLADEREINDLKGHAARVVAEFEKREDEIEKIRKSYANELKRIEENAQLYENKKNMLEIKVKEFIKEQEKSMEEQMERIRNEKDRKINEIENENRSLRDAIEKMGNERVVMAGQLMEKELLLSASKANFMHNKIDDMNVDINDDTKYSRMNDNNDIKYNNDLMNGGNRERLVCTVVADREAFKANEWKRIVMSKCEKCSSRPEENSCAKDKEEIIKMGNEVAGLSLKLKQAERVNEDNRRIIEMLRDSVKLSKIKRHSNESL
ncbi:myosin heavy chain 9/10/11/14, partial [Enteropsectra breve]